MLFNLSTITIGVFLIYILVGQVGSIFRQTKEASDSYLGLIFKILQTKLVVLGVIAVLVLLFLSRWEFSETSTDSPGITLIDGNLDNSSTHLVNQEDTSIVKTLGNEYKLIEKDEYRFSDLEGWAEEVNIDGVIYYKIPIERFEGDYQKPHSDADFLDSFVD